MKKHYDVAIIGGGIIGSPSPITLQKQENRWSYLKRMR